MSTVQYGPNEGDYVILLEDVVGDEPDDLEGQMLCGWAFDIGLKWGAELKALEPNYAPASDFAKWVLDSIRDPKW